MSDTRITFDEDGLVARVSRAAVDVLRRMGAYVRRTAANRVKTSKDASPPGSPPHSRHGLLRRAIHFGVERREKRVLIGPGFRFVGTSAAAHEFGGAYKAERYPKRPLMGPALRDAAPNLARLWQDAVK